MENFKTTSNSKASEIYIKLAIWQSVSFLFRCKNDNKINFISNEKYYSISRRLCHNIYQFHNNFPGEILENVQINQSSVTAGESFFFL